MRRRIPVPGDLAQDERFGEMYYALTKKDELCMIGIQASPNTMKRYRLEFTAEEAERHGLSNLPYEEVNENATK
ncbi:hypothetical protein [Loigolactobacillus bifermentans]|jgi:hypothetical protein|nr:hypothetical protein [Loigolactobacillus bifermentans]QGG59591.1 hypothetical protein LB003_03345 [Loigolactobacillus bifermentans]